MGVIQGSINSMLGTAGQAVAISKAIDIMNGPKVAGEALPKLEASTETAYQEYMEAEENAFTTSEGIKDIYMEEKGIESESEFGERSAMDPEWEQKWEPLTKASESHAIAAAQKYTQAQALEQRMKDIAEGKNKVGGKDVKKMLKEGK